MANMGKHWKQWKTVFWGGSKITADGDCSHDIKGQLFLGRKAMTLPDSILKSRDITLPTNICLVKAMVFPVVPVPYGCSVQFSSLSCVWLFATPWIIAHQASLSVTNPWSLLKLMSIESVMPSSHLILCHPLFLPQNPSQHQGLLQWVNSSHKVAKVLEFQL